MGCRYRSVNIKSALETGCRKKNSIYVVRKCPREYRKIILFNERRATKTEYNMKFHLFCATGNNNLPFVIRNECMSSIAPPQ